MTLAELKKKSRAQQFAWMRQVIKEDAEISNALYRNGKFCVIGGLANALGWSPHNSDGIKAYSLVERIPVVGGENRGNALWRTNDNHSEVKPRRRALLRLLSNWVKEDRVAARAR